MAEKTLIVRKVAAACIDGTSAVEDIIQSQVEIDRAEFERERDNNMFLLQCYIAYKHITYTCVTIMCTQGWNSSQG